MKESLSLAFFYSPFPNLTQSTKVAKELVSLNLVACVNIIPGVLSVYREDDVIKEQPEALVIFKVQPQHKKEFLAKLSDLHPHDTPAIIELKVEGVNPALLPWLTSLTPS